MLAMLPVLGACLGVLTGLIGTALFALMISQELAAAVMTGAYFLMTGFIHLDGYMDCCDAILPRHPDQERRRQILKDPHTGAFGAIGLVLMLLIFYGSMQTVALNYSMEALITFALITTVSRAMSSASVMLAAPMKSSQYSDMSQSMSRAKAVPVIVVTVLAFAAAGGIVLAFGLKYGSSESLIICLSPALVTAAACLITGAADRRALGGMNGDISGHMIVTGEMFGILAQALIMHLDFSAFV